MNNGGKSLFYDISSLALAAVLASILIDIFIGGFDIGLFWAFVGSIYFPTILIVVVSASLYFILRKLLPDYIEIIGLRLVWLVAYVVSLVVGAVLLSLYGDTWVDWTLWFVGVGVTYLFFSIAAYPIKVAARSLWKATKTFVAVATEFFRVLITGIRNTARALWQKFDKKMGFIK